MVRWLPNEIAELLRVDPEVRILIVEGEGDLRFWRRMVPESERRSTQVYSITTVEIESESTGNKDRALTFARFCSSIKHSDRIHFFLDGDSDAALGIKHPVNVTLTDGRDMESYCLDSFVTEVIFDCGVSSKQLVRQQFSNSVVSALRPIGNLRNASQRKKLGLPINGSIGDGRLKKSLSIEKNGTVTCDFNRLFSSIDGKCRDHGIETHNLHALIDEENRVTSSLPNMLIVHGKDLVAFFAKVLDIDMEQCHRICSLSMSSRQDVMRSYPNMASVEGWVRQA